MDARAPLEAVPKRRARRAQFSLSPPCAARRRLSASGIQCTGLVKIELRDLTIAHGSPTRALPRALGHRVGAVGAHAVERRAVVLRDALLAKFSREKVHVIPVGSPCHAADVSPGAL